ncbi:MAG: TolC family protein [Candidatus Eisenbacteria bacterium]|nr:TolC family protein [Candidatus Eisenbacteria bacterium]
MQRFASVIALSLSVVCWPVVQAVAAQPATDRPAAGPRKLSLEESIELALANNKAALIQRQEVENMNAQVTQARSAAFPYLSGYTQYLITQGTMNFGGSEGFTFDLDDKYYEAGVTLQQTVYSAGRVGAALKAAKAARGYARENLEATLKEVTYGVKASFGGVLLAQEMSDLAKQSLQLAEAHLKNVEQLYEQGVASEYELIRARVQVAQMVPASIRAENELDQALIVFRNTLGLSADEKVVPEGKLEKEPVETTVEEAFALAKQERSELAAARLRVDGMKAAVAVAKADRYPSLSLIGNAYLETEEPKFDDKDWRTKMWSATLNLSIPIFDGLRTKGKIRQTEAQYEQARLLSEQALDGVRLEVEQAVSKLAEARKLVDSQVASVEQAQKGLDIAEIRYKNGVGTQLEVLDAQVSLSTARTNYFTAVYEHFMAIAELERATGAKFE